MVSPLWFASDNGDAAQVAILLNDITVNNLEIKDESGATPLVQAVKKGHVQVVKALLDAGADATVQTSAGGLDQLTQDQAILDLLASARDKNNDEQPKETVADISVPPADGVPAQVSSQPPPQQQQQYIPTDGTGVAPGYPPHPDYYAQASYMYYPSPYPAMMPDGAPAPGAYYPPQHPPQPASASPADSANGSNLPPPEIARLIPCRYFPACRYGPSCIFAHPQGPYFQGPLPPPAQYPPFDPMTQPPYGSYYAPYAPNAIPPIHTVPPAPGPASANPVSSPSVTLTSPPLPPNHTRSGSELVSPMQGPFTPASGPPPLPFALPAPYPPQGVPPMSIPPIPAPPAQNQPQPPNGVMYTPTSPIVHATNGQNIGMPYGDAMMIPNGVVQQSQGPQNGMGANPGAGGAGGPTSQDVYARSQSQAPRGENGYGNHLRRGSVRRPSAMGPSRKPACAFFPSGRCRNGDSCKFPHILPDSGESMPSNGASKYASTRSRTQSMYNLGSSAGNENLNEKMANLNLRNDSSGVPQLNGHANSNHQTQGPVNGYARPPHNNFKYPVNGNGNGNNVRHEKRNGGGNGGNGGMNGSARAGSQHQQQPQYQSHHHHHQQQRIPNADDFPVLAGSVTPPARSPGVGPMNGPTAAQVLQAPAPYRKPVKSAEGMSDQATNNNGIVDGTQGQGKEKEKETTKSAPNGMVNGINGVNGSGSNSHDIKPPSFAAVATGASSTVESINNTVSVSA